MHIDICCAVNRALIKKGSTIPYIYIPLITVTYIAISHRQRPSILKVHSFGYLGSESIVGCDALTNRVTLNKGLTYIYILCYCPLSLKAKRFAIKLRVDKAD